MSEFYILSFKHTRRCDRLLTWWGPNNSGYVYRLKYAGRYTEEQIARDRSYYDNGDGTLAVPCEAVDPLGVPVGNVKSLAIERNRPTDEHVVEYKHLVSLKKAHGARKKRDAYRESYRRVAKAGVSATARDVSG